MSNTKRQKDKKGTFTFKRLIIEEVKKFPQVWFHNENLQNADLDGIFEIIRTCIHSSQPVSELRRIWRSIRNYYLDLLVLKAVRKNNIAPSWELFHDLTFLYESAVHIVREKTGGLSIPKFLPSTEENDENKSCPCCLPVKNVQTKKVVKKPSAKLVDSNIESRLDKSIVKPKQNESTKQNELTKQNESTKQKNVEPAAQIDLVSDTEEEKCLQDYNMLINKSIPGIPFIHCLSTLDKDDDFSIEKLDKLKDYDREVLYFSDTKPQEVICLDDDD